MSKIREIINSNANSGKIKHFSGENREGQTPKGVIHHLIAEQRGFGHLVVHGDALEGATPSKVNNMRAAEQMAKTVKSHGMNI